MLRLISLSHSWPLIYPRGISNSLDEDTIISGGVEQGFESATLSVNSKTHAAREVFQQVIKYKLSDIVSGPWLSLPVCLLSFLSAALWNAEGGKGPEFSSSERGSKPRANENAKPNRD